MILRPWLFLSMMLSMLLTWSCSDDDNKAPKEPVAAEQKMDKAPDALGGEAGEAGAKPAGVGTAEAPPSPAPAEKSEPAVEAAKDASAVTGQFTVKPKQLNVRKGPSTKDPVVRTMARGDKVETLGCEKHWCKVAEGEYVSEKYLKKAK